MSNAENSLASPSGVSLPALTDNLYTTVESCSLKSFHNIFLKIIPLDI